jgi:hypothetical protein
MAQDNATTFKPGFAPIFRRATAQADVVLFSPIRHMPSRPSDKHRHSIEPPAAWLYCVHKIPNGQMIRAAQSSAGWRTLEAAA